MTDEELIAELAAIPRVYSLLPAKVTRRIASAADRLEKLAAVLALVEPYTEDIGDPELTAAIQRARQP